MKRIELTQGKFAIVDDWRFEELNCYKWKVMWNKATKSFYAVRSLPRENGNRKTSLMHRVVSKTESGMYCDHINHNTLDNRECNLRNVTNSQNMMNRSGAQVNSKSGVRGVVWNSDRGKWQAQIRKNRKNIYLGLFESLDDAANAYRDANKKYFGEYGGKP